MNRYIFRFVKHLKLRWKMVVMVMPLVILPIFLVGSMIGSISTRQAYLGITQTSKDDLSHMAAFSLDLLDAHHQQFEVYRQDKKRIIREELAALTTMAYNLVRSEHRHAREQGLTVDEAKEAAKKALREVHVGETGYIYAMTSKGNLAMHIAREGENVYDERDEQGNYFLRDIIERAVNSDPDDILYATYPWRNAILGDLKARKKVVAFRYFREWDWIIASGTYLDETVDDAAFEEQAFEDLKEKIRSKKVGKTGYIFAMNSEGTFTVHPEEEGKNFYDARDSSGQHFIKEMCEKKEGWIRYPWQNENDPKPRMKIVRYDYFEPWDWIVAVGSYEDEFYQEANAIKGRIFTTMLLLPLIIGVVAVVLVLFASRVLTEPIHHMIGVIRNVKKGRFDSKMNVDTQDELGELATTFNRMTTIISKNKEMEANLAQQGKMASLGVLSSGVAHEINNPLGVILGYAGYIETKLDESDPSYKYIHEIKRESKRCKKIVQDLLSYARTPKPSFEPLDINELLDQIIEFAANHTDMQHVEIVRNLDPDLPGIEADGDQIRQVAINLMLNAGAAMEEKGVLRVATRRQDGDVEILFSDNGPGIEAESLDKIFEPFYTTKEKGTGLGLAITKQIVDQHHGRIEIDSTPGTGTRVTISLPIEREEY